MVNVTDALTALAAYGVLLIANNELVKKRRLCKYWMK